MPFPPPCVGSLPLAVTGELLPHLYEVPSSRRGLAQGQGELLEEPPWQGRMPGWVGKLAPSGPWVQPSGLCSGGVWPSVLRELESPPRGIRDAGRRPARCPQPLVPLGSAPATTCCQVPTSSVGPWGPLWDSHVQTVQRTGPRNQNTQDRLGCPRGWRPENLILRGSGHRAGQASKDNQNFNGNHSRLGSAAGTR